MLFIKGNNREQLGFSTLKMKIESDNPVRFVDAFVEHLDLIQLGFEVHAFKNGKEIAKNKQSTPKPTENLSTFSFHPIPKVLNPHNSNSACWLLKVLSTHD